MMLAGKLQPRVLKTGCTQVGGGLNRWIASHHLQVVVHAVRRLPASRNMEDADPQNPQSGSWHMLNQHLDWALPVLLQFVASMHSLYTPQVGAGLHCLQALCRVPALHGKAPQP